MKPPRVLEQITVRRAQLVDTDKVRYRVYKNPADFVAVIAESALMAVKVAGIPKPYKIVRDMPTDGIAIEAQKMAKVETPEQVILSMAQSEIAKQIIAELAPVNPRAKQEEFRPITLTDLQNKSSVKASILPPGMIHEIIEQHAKSPATAAAMPEVALAAPPLPAEPALPSDHPLQMVKTALTDPESVIVPEPELSTDEVDKLLNG